MKIRIIVCIAILIFAIVYYFLSFLPALVITFVALLFLILNDAAANYKGL